MNWIKGSPSLLPSSPFSFLQSLLIRSPSLHSIGRNVESVLLFFYYGGCIMIGLKKFSRAFELLRMVGIVL